MPILHSSVTSSALDNSFWQVGGGPAIIGALCSIIVAAIAVYAWYKGRKRDHERTGEDKKKKSQTLLAEHDAEVERVRLAKGLADAQHADVEDLKKGQKYTLEATARIETAIQDHGKMLGEQTEEFHSHVKDDYQQFTGIVSRLDKQDAILEQIPKLAEDTAFMARQFKNFGKTPSTTTRQRKAQT